MRISRDWSDADDAVIRAGYNKRTTADMAKELGCTRNMIIGRAKRLGLSQSRPFINSPDRLAQVLDGRRQRRRERRRALRQEVRVTKARAKMSENGNGKGKVQEGVGLMDLQPHHCRSLLGYDTAALPVYCGLPKGEGCGSYCYMHYAIYHIKTPRQRDREGLNLRVIKSGAWA